MTTEVLSVKQIITIIQEGLIRPQVSTRLKVLIDATKEKQQESPFLAKLGKPKTEDSQAGTFDIMAEISKFVGVAGEIKNHMAENYSHLLMGYRDYVLTDDQRDALSFLNMVLLGLTSFDQIDLVKRLESNLIDEFTSTYSEDAGITAGAFIKVIESMMHKTLDSEILPALNTRVPGGITTVSTIFNTISNIL